MVAKRFLLHFDLTTLSVRSTRSKNGDVLAATGLLLILSRCVTDDNQAYNLAIANTKVVRQDQVASRKFGVVICAVVGSADDRVLIVIDNFTDVNGHLITDHLFLHPTGSKC